MKKREPQSVRRKRSDKALKDAGAQITVAEGYQAVTFERIGKSSGYSRSLITQKYGSKEKFVSSLLEGIAETGRKEYVACLESTESALQKIENYVGTLFERISNDKQINAHFMLFADALANRRERQEFFRKSHRMTRDDLTQIIEQGQKEGDIDPALVPDVAATVVGSLMLGIVMQSLLEPDADLQTITQAAIVAIKRALSPA